MVKGRKYLIKRVGCYSDLIVARYVDEDLDPDKGIFSICGTFYSIDLSRVICEAPRVRVSKRVVLCIIGVVGSIAAIIKFFTML